MKRKMILIGSLATLMLAGTTVQADDGRLAADRIDEALKQGTTFGFQHFQEIEAKERDTLEIEGWLDETWQADVRLSLENGESLEEQRNRRDGGAWGMNEEDVRLAMQAAVAEGLVEFEEIQVDRDGRVEIEGIDADGREIEVRTQQGESGLVEVERD